MWYPFKKHIEKKALREYYKQRDEGKFVLRKAISTEGVRESWDTYYFNIPWEDHNIYFYEICLEILGELLQSFQVTAYINNYLLDEKQEQGPELYGWQSPEPTAPYLYKVLTAQTPVTEILWYAEGYLIDLANQLDRPLPTIVNRQLPNFVFGIFSLYCNRVADPSTNYWDRVQWPIDRRSCDVWVDFRTHPDELAIEVNAGHPDADAIVEIVKRACAACGKEMLIEVGI